MQTTNRETAAVIEMAEDTMAVHAQDGCCTPDQPCSVVAYYQGKLAEFAAGRTERGERDAAPETPGHRPAAGSKAANQYGTFQVKYATEAQLRYVRSLLARKDRSGLTEFNATVVAKAQAAVDAQQISKRLASDALDILTTLPDRTDIPAPAVKLASDKQVALITRLMGEKDLTGTAFPQWTEEVIAGLTSKQASSAIDMLFALPKVATKAPAAMLESGIYAVGDKVYKVYFNQAKTHMLAKLLVLGGEGEKASWEYQGAAARFVKAEQRMTLEQAKAFGAIYGVCCNCGATLTDETSIEAGIGPVCAGRFQS